MKVFVFLIGLILFGCIPEPTEQPAMGILAITCEDEGHADIIKQLYYSLDGGEEKVLGEGSTAEYLVTVGEHNLTGYTGYWMDGQTPWSYTFDEQVEVWDAAYGETTWSR